MIGISFQWLKHCTEIPMLLLFYGLMICDPVNTNFLIYRTCYASLGYNRSDCEKLGTKNADNATQELEKLVQPYANVISMTQSLATTIVPALFCLFIGPWSDKHGRKPILISTLAGFTIGSLMLIIIVLIPTMSPWYLLMGSISVVAFGGFPSLLMAVLSYVTDITTTENRGMRIGIFEAVIALGMLLGNLSSSYVFDLGGYIGVFSIAIGCKFLACLYCAFVLSETVIYTGDHDDTSVLSWTNISDMLKATFRRRESYTRSILLLTITMAVIFILASSSDGAVFFMFVRGKFHWNLEKYTLFKSVREFLWIIGTFVGLAILHKLLKLKEAALLLLGFLAYFVSAILQGLAIDDWYIYTAGAIRCISGVVSPMYRSLISKLILSDETGKVFSLTVTVESLILFIGTPLYTLIYNSTLNTNPGVFNFLTAGLFGVEIILVIIVIVIQKAFLTVNDYAFLSVNT